MKRSSAPLHYPSDGKYGSQRGNTTASGSKVCARRTLPDPAGGIRRTLFRMRGMCHRSEGAGYVCRHDAPSLAAREGQPARVRFRSGAWRMAALVPAQYGDTGARGSAADHRLSEYGHHSSSEGRSRFRCGAAICFLSCAKNGSHTRQRRNKAFCSPKREPSAQIRLHP